METKIYTVEELKNLFLETFINFSGGKVTKISDNSVLNGIAYGVSKIAQRQIKDCALIESELFPEYCFGKHLDIVAERFGVSSRLGAQGSSCYLRIVAEPNTLYSKDTVSFYSISGIQFSLIEDFVVGSIGFGYCQVKSIDLGALTNVLPNSIIKIVNAPSGHLYVINETSAWGGSDIETDLLFKQRILQNFNNFASDTVIKIKYILNKINPIILDIKKLGINSSYQNVLGIITSNGVNLSSEELDSLLSKLVPFLSITDMGTGNGKSSIILQNIEYEYIDIDFRIEIDPSYSFETVRLNILQSINSYFDFRVWNRNIEWENLYTLIRKTPGVKFVPSQYFNPSKDTQVNNKLPRLRGFIMRDLEGLVIIDSNNYINPVYYSDQYNFNMLNFINSNV